FHGRHYVGAPDTDVLIRRVQVSARTHLGQRLYSLPLYPWHGVYRPDSAFRSGRLLGPWNRRIDHGTCSVHRSAPGALDARRTDHRWTDAVEILFAARVHRSWLDHCIAEPASAPGVNQRH